MVYTLVYRCFCICSNWTQFHTELTFLKGTYHKNGYPENVIDRCFKKFLNNTNSGNKVFASSPSILRKNIFFQTRTKLQQALKSVVNCWKLEIVFRYQTRLSDSIHYKDQIAKDLISGVAYKLQCGLCNESYYGESIRHLDIRSRERRSNHQIRVLFVIIYSIAICYPLLTTLVF